MLVLLAALLALLAAAPAADAQVQVHVDLGFHLPAPPRLVVVPQVPAVQYVPAAATPGNIFFYNGQYWVFQAGGWYVSGAYNGPWVVVGPQVGPRPGPPVSGPGAVLTPGRGWWSGRSACRARCSWCRCSTTTCRRATGRSGSAPGPRT